jgi:hypothetical protein
MNTQMKRTKKKKKNQNSKQQQEWTSFSDLSKKKKNGVDKLKLYQAF